MKTLFYKFGSNIARSVLGKNLKWHLVAIASTYLIVISGFDWAYYQFFRNSSIYTIAFSTAAIGGLVPIVMPLILMALGKIQKKAQLFVVGCALGQSALLGSLISSLYKAFTGRAHPEFVHDIVENITHIFQFGFLRGGIFWGWPSSHTTIAFAMAFTLWALYPKNLAVKAAVLAYALFIGIGVSMTIHWFSDFSAGMIIGIVIGTVVGKAFRARL